MANLSWFRTDQEKQFSTIFDVYNIFYLLLAIYIILLFILDLISFYVFFNDITCLYLLFYFILCETTMVWSLYIYDPNPMT